MIVHRVLDPNADQQIAIRSCALAVMTKAPRAGKVKTRLVPPLTKEEAAALNACFLQDLASAISSATLGGKASGVAVYTPRGAEEAYRGILPNDFFLVPQRGETFGERLIFAAEDLFRLGFASICLINSDSPTVPAAIFSEAVTILSRSGDRVVLGPAEDGGYYLIGLKKLHRAIFEKIDWSTEKVLGQTMERAAQLDLEVHLLPAWFDVDDRTTLRRLYEALFGDTRGHSAPATRDFLAELVEKKGEPVWPNE
jgi:rSAM/selenodomain-associated transferase 1